MLGNSIDLVSLLMRGLPECILIVLALHLFTRTQISPKKFILLNVVYAISVYILRLLPIAPGVHSIVALVVLVLAFQATYKTELAKTVRLIISSISVIILIAISELANVSLLFVLFGREKAMELVGSDNSLVYSLAGLPSVVFFALLIVLVWQVLKIWERKGLANGETRETTGE